MNFNLLNEPCSVNECSAKFEVYFGALFFICWSSLLLSTVHFAHSAVVLKLSEHCSRLGQFQAEKTLLFLASQLDIALSGVVLKLSEPCCRLGRFQAE